LENWKFETPSCWAKRVSIFLVQYLEKKQKIIVRFFYGKSTMYLSNTSRIIHSKVNNR
jgi:hypothetical protein